MNKSRRERIANLQGNLAAIESLLGELADEEQDARDNLPESFDMSPKAEDMENAVEVLLEAAITVGDAISGLDGVLSE